MWFVPKLSLLLSSAVVLVHSACAAGRTRLRRVRSGLLLAISIFVQVSLSAGHAEPTTMSLNGTWRFSLARTPEEAAALAGFEAPAYDDAGFREIPVPSNWALLGLEEPVYRGFKDNRASEGFYRVEFDAPTTWKGKRMLMHFDGVWSSAEVWLNGVPLGRHDSGFTGFAFNVSEAVRPGERNCLAVRVRQITREYSFDVYDDWTLGGIYRDVWLEAMPAKRWLDQVVTQTTFDEAFCDANLAVRVLVGDRHKPVLPGNYDSPGEPYELVVSLRDDMGKEVARDVRAVSSHYATDREVRLVLPVKAPRRWTAETPVLYTLQVELREAAGVSHTRTERVGFRQISTTGGVFRINGQAVKLRGVNRHDEHPDVGRATTREHWLRDITLMKEANINFVRLSHYPPAKGFIELCDELGLYLGNEVSIGGAGDLLYDPSFNGAVLQRVYETVTRDLNRPSVIYWSVGNEDPLTALHLAAVRTVKGLDPTRPVLLPWRAEGWLPPEVDMLAPHYWKPQEYDALASNATRPIISTEYTHAYGTNGFGGLEARWKALTKHPAGAGAAVWMWADQGLRPNLPDGAGAGERKLRLSGEGWDGIVDSDRKPTRDYWETKAVYAQVYPVVDRLSFQPGSARVRVPIQNDFDFTDLGDIRIEWILWEDDRELARGHGETTGASHTVGAFDLPLTSIDSVRSDATYLAWFVFRDAKGHEITRRAVELEPTLRPPTTGAASPLTVTDGDSLVVRVAEAEFVFSRASGHLTAIRRGTETLLSEVRPVLWRTLDDSERAVLGKEAARQAVDLTRYTSVVDSWRLERNSDNVTLSVTVTYKVDERNRYAIEYRYCVTPDHAVTITYLLRPEVSVPWLPVVGLVLQPAAPAIDVRWLGLGPYDAYPNKKSAPILGVWRGVTGGSELVGIKAIRWVELGSAQAPHLRVVADGYLESSAETPTELRLLSSVLSRPEKGRKADESFPQMLTNASEPFVGECRIQVLSK